MESSHPIYLSEVRAQAAEFRFHARQARIRNQIHAVKITEMIARVCCTPLGNLPGILESDAVSIFEATE